MTQITYIEASGQSTTVDLPDGWSLMQGATANGVDGILGECGGSCACATCHVYVDDAWLGKTGDKSAMEESMLDFAENVEPNSRLSCQIQLTEALADLSEPRDIRARTVESAAETQRKRLVKSTEQ